MSLCQAGSGILRDRPNIYPASRVLRAPYNGIRAAPRPNNLAWNAMPVWKQIRPARCLYLDNQLEGGYTSYMTFRAKGAGIAVGATQAGLGPVARGTRAPSPGTVGLPVVRGLSRSWKGFSPRRWRPGSGADQGKREIRCASLFIRSSTVGGVSVGNLPDGMSAHEYCKKCVCPNRMPQKTYIVSAQPYGVATAFTRGKWTPGKKPTDNNISPTF